ncbi:MULTISPECIES: exonuclease [unclassified Mesorhizobium]|uniref:exonuclease n=1 Tax=unclassified Mesorhizobium TaxID=325217 RepID=UPI000FCCC004|nr:MULTISPECIES: exonuclease [unclassified Mesorhizobium]RUT86785.1 exonuclease [Mesorhizobium sp. M7A.T.Ca.US.000.02.2.1]RUT87630.1 exonuclease [Mesorhizobium sp. M7A.T.Ca.US.000.02.1.1]
MDGDLFAYQMACGVEKPLEFDGTFILSADADEGKANLDAMFDHFKETLDADRIIVCLSDTENFRKTVLPTYKSNRDGIRRPMILGALKAHIEENYETFTRPTLEADDVLGILLTNPKVVTGEKIVITEDKDLRSVPGLHWNPKKDTDPVLVSVEQADREFYAQTLSGDMVDGYGGCPNIGYVRSREIVDERRLLVRTEEEIKRGKNAGKTRVQWLAQAGHDDLWACIVSHYEKAGLTKADALSAARVARILRTEDYNYKTKEPILWTPSK